MPFDVLTQPLRKRIIVKEFSIKMRIKTFLPLFVLLALVVLGFSAAPSFADDGVQLNSKTAPLLHSDSPTAIPDQYIVVFQKGTTAVSATAVMDAVAALGGRVGHTYTDALHGFAAYLPAKALDAVRANPAVEYVEVDQIMTIIDVQPNPTWGLDRIDQRNLPLDNQYVYNYTGAGVKVYTIDTGIRTTHNEFGGRVAGGYNATGDNNGYNDCNGHGTHVSGTIGGSTYGVAKGVTFYAVRVLGCNGSGPTSDVIEGVDWVTSQHTGSNPAVANMSLGGSPSNSMDNAVINSINDGVFYAIAAGNSNANACNYSPARVAAAITVGATNSNDTRSSFSNYGSCLDVFAPGENITSAWYTSDSATNTISGTSMASPHVAGVAALWLQANPSDSPAATGAQIVSTATPGVVGNPGSGSPNLLLYSLLEGGGDPGGCEGSPDFTGSLSGTGDVDYGWYSAGSGTQELCLEGTGPDFDLYLLKRGALGGWSVVASSLGATSSEQITYSGTSGYYLWYIRSYQGSGTWQLWVSYP